MKEQEQQEIQKQIIMLENIAKKHLSKEAIERYGRMKLAHTATAIQVIAIIAQAAQMGQISGVLSDNEFKELLRKIQEGKQEFKFKK